MNIPLMPELLRKILLQHGQVEVSIAGSSMYPIFCEHDTVTIKPSASYNLGDILVYPYKSQGLLIHRVIYVDDVFYCKGDNAFKTETIHSDTVLGKAVLVNQNPIREWQEWQIQFSITIAKLFMKLHQNYDATMHTPVYRMYTDVILKQSNSLIYKTKQINFDANQLPINQPLQFELVSSILHFFIQPNTLDNLLHHLYNFYPMDIHDLQNDVMLFLIRAVADNMISIL